MDSRNRLREVANLRFAFQSKSRMRLEFLGELSKLLRIHGHTVNDDILASLVLAVPEELPGEGFASAYNTQYQAQERPPMGDKSGDRPPTAPRPPMDDKSDQPRPPMGEKKIQRPPEAFSPSEDRRLPMQTETLDQVTHFAPPDRPPTARKAAKKKPAKKPVNKKYLDDTPIQSNLEVTDATQHIV